MIIGHQRMWNKVFLGKIRNLQNGRNLTFIKQTISDPTINTLQKINHHASYTSYMIMPSGIYQEHSLISLPPPQKKIAFSSYNSDGQLKLETSELAHHLQDQI